MLAAVQTPRPAVVLAIGALAVMVVVLVVAPLVFTAEDSLFYVVIGRHVVDGDGVTFNGLMATNGFQPLWQLGVIGVVALARLLGIDGDVAQIRLVALLSVALTLVALVLLSRLVERFGGGGSARLVAVAVLVVYLAGPLGMLGSEAHLAAVLVLVAALLLHRLTERDEVASTSDAVWFGVALGAMVLARLDLVFLAAGFGLVLVLAWRKRSDLVTRTVVAAAAVTAALVVAPYLLWNQVRFGHLVPISGALKYDIFDPRFSLTSVGRVGLGLLAIAVVAGGYGYVGTGERLEGRRIWLALLGGAAAASAYTFVAAQDDFTTWNWYYVPHCLAAAVGGAAAAHRLTERASSRGHGRAMTGAVAALSVALLVLAAGLVVRRPLSSVQDQRDETLAFARSLQAEVDPSDRIATVDLPGVLGLGSRRPVVALDGLTNDFDYQDDLVDLGVSCTLSELGVRYLVTYETGPASADTSDGGLVLGVRSLLHDADAGVIDITESDEVFRGSSPPMVVWRIDPDCSP